MKPSDTELRNRLHYRNLRQVDRNDVIVASYGAAGQALLGNVLLELGLNYVNPANEVLGDDGSSRPLASQLSYRARLPAMSARDACPANDKPSRSPLRFMKTHLFPAEFDSQDYRGIWILSRDPRDAIYSWYKIRQVFPEADWEKATGTFEEFLREPDYTHRRPVTDWAIFYDEWLQRASSRCCFAITRFEDLKQRGVETVRTALAAFGVKVSAVEVGAAVDRSSYEKMRAHEDEVARFDRDKTQARLMRRGKIGEWRDWITPDLRTYFADDQVRSVARRLGYTLADRSDHLNEAR
jgi:hypothetical protein